jgi:hypothetical protein
MNGLPALEPAVVTEIIASLPTLLFGLKQYIPFCRGSVLGLAITDNGAVGALVPIPTECVKCFKIHYIIY